MEMSSTIKKMCKKAGLVGKFTNHSLRATSASRMYEQDIPEQVIKEITGHRSDAVRTYKHTPDSIRQKASLTINGGECSKVKKMEGEVVDVNETEDKSSDECVDSEGEALKQRVEESLNACKMIKNVIRTRLEMRKKQGDKARVCKRKVAQKLVKKQKNISKKVKAKSGKGHVVIDLNVNVQ